MKRAHPKYQIFISSTYADLRVEREAVTWTILTQLHIPAGMEAFSASNDRGWETIRRVIDESDYYVLIMAGRYGSIDDETGISWTHREYRYARELGLPILAFVREDSSITRDKMEDSPKGQQRQQEFVDEVSNSHLYKRWREKEDLCSVVAQALGTMIRRDERDGNPRPGWYRGDQVASPEVLEEFARLSGDNSALRRRVKELEESSERESVELKRAEADLTPHGVVIAGTLRFANTTLSSRVGVTITNEGTRPFLVRHVWGELTQGESSFEFCRFSGSTRTLIPSDGHRHKNVSLSVMEREKLLALEPGRYEATMVAECETPGGYARTLQVGITVIRGSDSTVISL